MMAAKNHWTKKQINLCQWFLFQLLIKLSYFPYIDTQFRIIKACKFWLEAPIQGFGSLKYKTNHDVINSPIEQETIQLIPETTIVNTTHFYCSYARLLLLTFQTPGEKYINRGTFHIYMQVTLYYEHTCSGPEGFPIESGMLWLVLQHIYI